MFVQRLVNLLWPDCNFYKLVSVKDENHIILGKKSIYTEDKTTEADSSNSNLPEVFSIIETDQTYYFLASYRGATLQDLITYNPGVLSSNLKKSFVIYQLLRVIASLHDRGILHGSLMASNILVDENLWIQLAGIEFSPNPKDFGEYTETI